MDRAFAGLFLVLAIGTNSAYAHAGMMGSTPKDGEVLQTNPGQISMRFTETLEPDLVTVRLFDWDGKEIQCSDRPCSREMLRR